MQSNPILDLSNDVSLQQSNLRYILVRTTSCQVHPATCTRLWKDSFGIAWVLYQLGSLHNAKRSTSAMSKNRQNQSKIAKNQNNSINPPEKNQNFENLNQSFIHMQKTAHPGDCRMINLDRYLTFFSFFSIFSNFPPSSFSLFLT